MISKTVSGTVASSSGANVDLIGGARINFTASSFVSAGSNSAYSGEVSVSGFYLNPADENLADYMPGYLRGIRATSSISMASRRFCCDKAIKVVD